MAAHDRRDDLSPAGRRRVDLDEDDVRVRPARGSRPRTRQRPAYDDAALGFVTTVDRGRYNVLLEGRDVTAMRAREMGRRGVVVGDRVRLVGDTSGTTDTLARIVRIEERTSVLRRSADDDDPVERVIVANADQLVIVTALENPAPRTRFIDRCLVAAYDAGLDPILCLTKADLAPPDGLLAAYAPLGVPAVVTGRAHYDEDVSVVRDHLLGRVSVLIGHSGVGKSTLVNRLLPDARRATGSVNVVTGRGRHTSSSAIALALDGRSWIVDTPGVRSFGLAHVDLRTIVAAFPDLAPATENCPRGCQHTADDEECALDACVADGHADPARLESLRRLLASRTGED